METNSTLKETEKNSRYCCCASPWRRRAKSCHRDHTILHHHRCHPLAFFHQSRTSLSHCIPQTFLLHVQTTLSTRPSTCRAHHVAPAVVHAFECTVGAARATGRTPPHVLSIRKLFRKKGRATGAGSGLLSDAETHEIVPKPNTRLRCFTAQHASDATEKYHHTTDQRQRENTPDKYTSTQRTVTHAILTRIALSWRNTTKLEIHNVAK